MYMLPARGRKLNRKVHFVSDQTCSGLVRAELLFLVPYSSKRKIRCALSLMKSFYRSGENSQVISYSRTIHMNLCLKKTMVVQHV